MDIQTLLPQIATALSFSATALMVVVNSKKANTKDVVHLADDFKKLKLSNALLEETDIEQQRTLNQQALDLSELRHKNRLQEEKLAEYYAIITDRDPEIRETLGLLTSGVSQILEKLNGAEVIHNESK